MALAPALALAAADWVAVATGARRAEYIFKPAALTALIAAAVYVGPGEAGTTSWVLLLAALAFSLLGDVFLMLPRDRFVYGLGAFLIAHLCYVGAFGLPPPSIALAGVAIAIAAVSLGLLRRIRAGLLERGATKLLLPVYLYVAAIGTMVVCAIGTAFSDWPGSGALTATVGALLFYVSDALIGWTRFVEPIANSRIAIMVSYHLGQMGLVVALTA